MSSHCQALSVKSTSDKMIILLLLVHLALSEGFQDRFRYLEAGKQLQKTNDLWKKSPNYFQFHHQKNRNQAPKVYPYTEKGLIRLDVPVSDVEQSILEDLQRQTKNFSHSHDLIPVEEPESGEWEVKSTNSKPKTEEKVKSRTKFHETFEQTPRRPTKASSILTPTTSKPKYRKRPKSSTPAPSYRTSTASSLLNFDAYLRQKPKVLSHPSPSESQSHFRPMLPNNRQTPFVPVLGVTQPKRKPGFDHSFEWEEGLKATQPAATKFHHHEGPAKNARKNLFQDIYSKNTYPYHWEHGHLMETPYKWEERFEDVDLMNNRNRGKVIWSDRGGARGQQYWDLA